MRVQVHIARTEHKASAKLERILAELMLAMTGRFRPSPRLRVIGAKHVQDVGLLETRCAIREPLLVDQKRESDPGVFPENPRVVAIAEAHGSEASSAGFELLLMFAQLRDVLAAENSSVVAKKDQHRGSLFPQRPEPDPAVIRVGQDDRAECLAERLGHE